MNSSGPASLEIPFGTFRITARSQRPGAAGSVAAAEGLPTGGSAGSGNGTATTSAALGMEAGLEDGAGSRGASGSSGGHTSGPPQLVMRDGMVQGDADVTIRPDDARSSAVVLMVGPDAGRDTWRGVMADTRGQLTEFFTTPTHFVGATVGGQVVMSKIPFITGAMGSSSGSDAAVA